MRARDGVLMPQAVGGAASELCDRASCTALESHRPLLGHRRIRGGDMREHSEHDTGTLP